MEAGESRLRHVWAGEGDWAPVARSGPDSLRVS